MVGLTGGIGAGKSAVARRLAEHGAVVIDSDRLAREVVAPGTDGLAEVVAAFGPEVLGADGGLDRTALGARVFDDEPARRRLEQIVHPRVRARTAELAAAAAPDAIVVNDVPLLVEAGLAPSYHLVVVVQAAVETRLRRLVETRAMAAEQARARIAAQASDERRRAAGDVLLRNDADLAALDAAVDRLWRDRLAPYEDNLRRRQPAPADPAVQIVAPDPAWAAQADRLIARVRHRLGAATLIEHVGSTAVPGLPGRDVVDLQLAVPAGAADTELSATLADLGLPRQPPAPAQGNGGPGPDRAHGGADPGRPVSLRLAPAGSPQWRAALDVRDRLRADPALRRGYAELKAAWADRPADPAGYAQAKARWFAQVAGPGGA
jgi:dephospho-CoA kinase